MKTACFKYEKKSVVKRYNETDRIRTTTIYGTVTLKNDGKVSISMPGYNNQNTSFAERYQAKLLAQEIVSSDFNHSAIMGEVKTDNKALISLLTEKTQDLKESYITQVKEYCKKTFEKAEKHIKIDFDSILKKKGLPFKDQNGKQVLDFSNLTKEQQILWRDLRKTRSTCIDLVNNGYVHFESKEIKYAEMHYESSLSKLSSRLIGKGIDETKEIQITNSKVGVNLHMTITSENVVVNAWTIIAEGVIQRPHYRYLVK